MYTIYSFIQKKKKKKKTFKKAEVISDQAISLEKWQSCLLKHALLPLAMQRPQTYLFIWSGG